MTDAEAATIPSLAVRLLSGEGPELAELLEWLDQAVTVRDRGGRLVFANRAALAEFGASSLADLLGRTVDDELDRYLVRDERGRPLERAAVPLVRLMETGVPPPPLLVERIERTTGSVVWHLIKTTALRDLDGSIVGCLTVIDDQTALRLAETRTRVLAECGRLLAAAHGLEQVLQSISATALPDLADWCVTELVDEPHLRAVAHVDGDKREAAAQVRELEGRGSDQSPMGRVLAGGEPELLPHVTDEQLQRFATSDAHLELLRSLRLRSVIVAPMAVGGRTIGAVSLATSSSRRGLTAEDLAIVEELARRASLAVEQRRMDATLAEVSTTLQHSLRPAPLPEVPGWEIGALYRPARGESRVEVGGDFYEVFVTGGVGFAMIGDVTGHGVAAATMTTLMRHGARFASHLEPDPAAIVRRLDEELRRREGAALCTTLCAALDTAEVILCSAGHPPALIVAGDGSIHEAPRSGPLLGAFSDSVWHQERVPIAPGGLVLLYTDGVIEAGGSRDRYGTERLRGFLAHHAGSAPAVLLRALDAELERFCDGPPADDVAALALRPRSAP